MELSAILLTVNEGVSIIDENLTSVIDYMGSHPIDLSLVGKAKAIGLSIALGVCAFECYMMMLGKRVIDVFKILRILMIAICISSSSWIASALRTPGDALKEAAHGVYNDELAVVATLEADVATKQSEYLKKLNHVIDSINDEKNKAALIEAVGEDGPGVGDFIDGSALKAGFDMLCNNLSAWSKSLALSMETKICEWISFVFKFIGQIVFSMMYYGILVAGEIGLALLAFFLPVAFAMSLAPPFSNAWSQMVSKILSVSLWGFVVYFIMIYVAQILKYNLEKDIEVYNGLMAQAGALTDVSWGTVGQLGMQGLGSTCMYVVAMFVGAKVLSMTTEFASWLIPGGVSSSAGSMAGAAAGAAVGGAMGAATGAAGVGVGLVGAGAGMAAKAPGTILAGAAAANSAGANGAGKAQAIMTGIMSQTGVGKKMAEAANNASSLGRAGMYGSGNK